MIVTQYLLLMLGSSLFMPQSRCLLCLCHLRYFQKIVVLSAACTRSGRGCQYSVRRVPLIRSACFHCWSLEVTLWDGLFRSLLGRRSLVVAYGVFLGGRRLGGRRLGGCRLGELRKRPFVITASFLCLASFFCLEHFQSRLECHAIFIPSTGSFDCLRCI